MFGKEENLNKWKDCYDCLSKLLSLYLIKASGWDKESIFKAKLNSLELSERQKTIAELLLSGKSNKDIAYKVNLSEQAIKYHIGNMLEKFKCKNRRELRAKITGLII